MWDIFFKTVTYPVQWFWKQYHSYKESRDIMKIVLLWFLSLTGITAISLFLFLAITYVLTHHMNLVIGLCLICWLYVYVRDKYCLASEPVYQVETDVQTLQEQAEKGYPVMRNIVYQTLKSIASDIGGKVPRLLGEIEMPEEHYILCKDNNICFYQFRLLKADVTAQYSANELEIYKSVIQTHLQHKIESGEFPNLKMESYRDKYGNWYDNIIIDTIEDVGNMFILQTVFCSPEYAAYRHEIFLSQSASSGIKPHIDEDWEDNH